MVSVSLFAIISFCVSAFADCFIANGLQHQNSLIPSGLNDQYENNNNVEDAYDLSQAFSDDPSDYTTSVNGVLIADAGNVLDVDYYTFSIPQMAEVIINLACPLNNFDYYFSVHKATYDSYNDWTTTSEVENVDDYLQSKSFSELLRAGTYYVVVYGDDSVQYSSDDTYSLTITVDYQTETEKLYSDARYVKGADTVLWLADYIPGDIQPFVTIDDGLTVHNSNLAYGNTEALVDDFYNEYGNTDILGGVLYIWDPAARVELKNVLLQIYSRLCSETTENSKIRGYVSKWVDISGTVMSTISLLFNDRVLSAIDFAYNTISNFVLNAVLPEIDIDTVNYLSFLQRLVGTLDCSITSDGYEVVSIPWYYSISFLNGKYSVNCSQNMVTINSSSSLVFSGDSLPGFTGNAIPGHTYIVNSDYSDGIIYDSAIDVNTSEILPLTTGPFSIAKLGKGEYKWYSFIPQSSGVYAIYGNSLSEYCIEFMDSAVSGHDVLNRYYFSSDGAGSYSLYSDVPLSEGEEVYFRISGMEFNACSDSLSMNISLRTNLEESAHVHSYEYSYASNNARTHKACCWCGDYILESHLFDRSMGYTAGSRHYMYCLICERYILNGTGLINVF